MSLADRVRGMIGRAIIGLVNDSTRMQSVQVTMQADQTADDVERLQQYGYTSVPFGGAEGIALAIGGSTGHTVVINVDDRRYRLTGLQEGEVALYDDLGHKVHLTRNGIVINGGGHLVSLVNLEKLRVEADIEATGEIRDRCDMPESRSMAQTRAHQTTHTHKTNAIGAQTDAALQSV